MLRGVDCVFKRDGRRKGDFRGGIYLGTRDHLIVWSKPARPAWMDRETWQKIPDEITVRELRVGGRTIITTLLDHKEVHKKEVGELYQQRWQVEVDLRSIKTVLQMDILRCKTPEMVNKEIAVHLLGYNLIRVVMVQAAWRQGIRPREVKVLKTTVQLLNAFRQHGLLTDEENLPGIRGVLFKAIAVHRVMNRQGRMEPRGCEASSQTIHSHDAT